MMGGGELCHTEKIQQIFTVHQVFCVSVHLFLVVPDGATSILLQPGVVAASASVRANVVPHLHMTKDDLTPNFQKKAQLKL